MESGAVHSRRGLVHFGPFDEFLVGLLDACALLGMCIVTTARQGLSAHTREVGALDQLGECAVGPGVASEWLSAEGTTRWILLSSRVFPNVSVQTGLAHVRAAQCVLRRLGHDLLADAAAEVVSRFCSVHLQSRLCPTSHVD